MVRARTGHPHLAEMWITSRGRWRNHAMHVIFLARSFPSVLTSEIPVEVLIMIKELLNLNV
jgi:hypothetical protein